MKNIKILVIFSFICNLTVAQQDSNKLEFKTFYYPNGFKLSEGYLRNGKPDGYWITYYVDGKKKSEGNRKNYLLDSLWIFYAANGDTIETINYLFGKKNGFHTKYYTQQDSSRNIPKSRELYVDDKRQGFSYFYYKNGIVQYKIRYKDNVRDGEGFEYDQTGKLIALLEFRNDFLTNRNPVNRTDNKGQRTGLWVELHDNGKIKREINYQNGIPTGIAREYSPTGKLTKIDNYIAGKLVSQSDSKKLDTLATSQINIKYQYYDNTKLKSVEYFKDSLPVGIHIFYDEKGTITKAIVYNDFGEKIAEGVVDTSLQKQGEWILFDNHGNITAKGNYKNNLRTGQWQFFYPSGKIRQIGFYDKDKPVENWTWYYETGQKLREEYYVDGFLNNKAYEFSPSGDTILKCNYFDGQLHGEYYSIIGEELTIGKYFYDSREGEWQVFYYPSKKLKAKFKYADNRLNGQYREYYPNKTLKIAGQYSNNRKQGKWVFYRQDGNIDYTIEYTSDLITKVNDLKIE